MKHTVIFLFCVLICHFTNAQNEAADSGRFILHKFEKQVGLETYALSQVGNIIRYDINFKFVDRGRAVPLQAHVELSQSYEPLQFTIHGSTSRFKTINDSVVINHNNVFIKNGNRTKMQFLKPNTFTIAGFAPGTAQMLLIQYWLKHKRPSIIQTLPEGNVEIKPDGNDTIQLNGKNLVLQRYVVKGLIWGNELLWLDGNNKLFFLVTNDDEGDKVEIMTEEYEGLVKEMVNKAAVYGMRLFAKDVKYPYEGYKQIIIANAKMIDVKNGISIPNVNVVIEDGKIKNIVRGKITFPKKAFMVNAKGKTILPGLWDMHAHFEQPEWGPAYLAAGVTTVRDCGNELGYIEAIEKAINTDKGIGPNILKAGLIDGSGRQALGIVIADTKEAAIKAVDTYKSEGYAQIKIYYSVQPEILKIICAEAHRLGLTVTGHIPKDMTIMQAIDSGMDMVNHINSVMSNVKRDSNKVVQINDSTTQEVLSFIKFHKTVIDPTLGTFELAFRPQKDDIKEIEPLFETLPKQIQTIFLNSGEVDSAWIIYGKVFMGNAKKLVKAMFDEKIPIVAGTDMGLPGYSLWRELELYVSAGLTPAQALQTATIIPAQVMNVQNNKGSIEVGKDADLVIVDADPLQNIKNIRKISLVIKNGKIYNPVLLHQIAGFER